MEVSWDQTYSDVYLVDLRTGKPQQGARALGRRRHRAVAGRQVRPLFRRAHRPLVHVPHRRRRRARTSPRSSRVRFQQESTTPDLPGPYGTGGWTANDQSLLLYDEFDIWEIKPDGTCARMVTNGEGRKQSLIFRYRSLDPEERMVPTTKPLLLPTTNERTRGDGILPRCRSPARAAPEKTRDGGQGASARLTKAAKADTVVFTLSRFEEFPDLWVERHDLQGHEEGVERQPAAGRSSSGAGRRSSSTPTPTGSGCARS